MIQECSELHALYGTGKSLTACMPFESVLIPASDITYPKYFILL